jgi:hypothetical protein
MNTVEIVRIKSHNITFLPAKDSFNRRSLQYKNKIISALGKIGVKRDDVEIELDNNCGKKEKAFVTWYFNGFKLYYEMSKQQRFVDNLFIVLRVIEEEINLVLSDKKPLEEFISEFAENDSVHDERKEAREFFGLDHDHKDIEEINKKYKSLAKTLHPDTPTGDVERFKELNNHHKILKRELS